MKFEDYLRRLHAEGYTGTDDDMSDDFDNWLGDVGKLHIVIKTFTYAIGDNKEALDRLAEATEWTNNNFK